ncbi:MAG: hypothetical protein IPL40_15305 [Proteobacteria bacterium]|nr:hypothetical protein [Pseudomonadota bacterium]
MPCRQSEQGLCSDADGVPDQGSTRRLAAVRLAVLLAGALIALPRTSPADAAGASAAQLDAPRSASRGSAQHLCRRRRAPRRRRPVPPARGAAAGGSTSRGAATDAAPDGANGGAGAADAEAGAGAAQPPGTLRRGARVEFDGRLVQGQTAKSGAIYLFARKRSELRSMIVERTNYRTEILQTVYPERP